MYIKSNKLCLPPPCSHCTCARWARPQSSDMGPLQHGGAPAHFHFLPLSSTDFSQQLSEFDSRSGVPPACVAWCGVDAVALRWEGLLLLVGPYGDWLKRPCSGAVLLVTEVDGLRLLTNSSCSLLRRVPDALVQVCGGKAG